jgi:nicotinamidase-related amidase
MDEERLVSVYTEFLKSSDCLLLLVDIQKKMLELCMEAERTRKNARALIEIAKIFGLPIIFSQHNPEKLGGFLPELLKIVPNPQVLNKIEFSCFENRAIRAAIEATERKTLILAGLETHVCIFHSGASAMRLGHRVHVVADAVCSRSHFNWEIGLRRLERMGAVVSSIEMLIFELLNRAGTSEFRQALPIIKML